ncbi:hypothetical protein IC582_024106 [Cucumis melo]
MDRRCIPSSCHLLRTTAGLVGTKVIDVEEMVAMFMHILAHDMKNRMIQRKFVRCGETVSRHFNFVLLAVLRLHDELLKKSQPVRNSCTDPRWKWFEGRKISSFRVVWRRYEPTTAREFFNMKHSSIRNIIERAFGLLKGRWKIFRGKSYYPVDVQCRTIMACCLVHNLINREMTNSEIINDLDEGDSTYATTEGGEINYIEASNKWSE